MEFHRLWVLSQEPRTVVSKVVADQEAAPVMQAGNWWEHMFQRLFYSLLAVVCLTGPLVARNSNHSNHGLVNNPWSVQDFGAKGGGYLPPVCHQLSFFSGTPLHFDFGQDLDRWKPGWFTYTTDKKLIGRVDNRPIYQIIQDIQPILGEAPRFTGEIVMKRLLVQRRRSQFCIIFQEQNSFGVFSEIDPAELVTIDAEPVLYTHDPIEGNAGAYEDAAWTFDNGVPVPLLSSANNPIPRALMQTIPAGCTVASAEALNLLDLTFSSDLRAPGASMSDTSCGSVDLKLAIKNHRLVVVSKQYTPRAR